MAVEDAEGAEVDIGLEIEVEVRRPVDVEVGFEVDETDVSVVEGAEV